MERPSPSPPGLLAYSLCHYPPWHAKAGKPQILLRHEEASRFAGYVGFFEARYRKLYGRLSGWLLIIELDARPKFLRYSSCPVFEPTDIYFIARGNISTVKTVFISDLRYA